MSHNNLLKSELWRVELPALLVDKPELYEVSVAPAVLQAIKENA